jgi:hypothetical protein
MTISFTPESPPFVVFGYGSLIWKVRLPCASPADTRVEQLAAGQPPPHVIAQGAQSSNLNIVIPTLTIVDR